MLNSILQPKIGVDVVAKTSYIEFYIYGFLIARYTYSGATGLITNEAFIGPTVDMPLAIANINFDGIGTWIRTMAATDEFSSQWISLFPDPSQVARVSKWRMKKIGIGVAYTEEIEEEGGAHPKVTSKLKMPGKPDLKIILHMDTKIVTFYTVPLISLTISQFGVAYANFLRLIDRLNAT